MLTAKKFFTARVLHDGWEMDNEAWIEKDQNGNNVLKTTSHGWECKMSVEDLKEKIAETENSLCGLREALRLVE